MTTTDILLLVSIGIAIILCFILLPSVVRTRQEITRANNHSAQMEKLLDVDQRMIDENKDEMKQMKEEIGGLNDQIKRLVKANDDKRQTINELEKVVRDYETQKVIRENDEAASAKVMSAAEGLDEVIESKKDEISRLGTEIELKVAAKNEAQSEYEKVKNELEEVVEQFSWYKEELEKAVRSHRELLGLDLESGGLNERSFYVELNGKKEKRLVEVIRDLEEEYADLKKELATIEWKKVWLPKMQSICSEGQLDGVCGIYRLVDKRDMNVCYVGQAVNIKDRWYQHAKKLVGADSCGGERLYGCGYRIDDLVWEVVEVVEGNGNGNSNGAYLDEREEYWIEFFGCREKGLNKR